MEPIVFALSAALVLSLAALSIFIMLWMGERTAHHAAKALAEAEQNRFTAYQELVEEERRTRVTQTAIELVQPLWDQVNS
jgi:hypothetical protein